MRAASVQAGMRGSLYGARDIGARRGARLHVLQSEELRALGPDGLRRLVRATVGGAARLPLVRRRLPRPGLRARDRARRRSPASRRPRRSPSCARCAGSRSSAPTSSRSRRPTTGRGSRPRSRRRTSASSCSRCGRWAARRDPGLPHLRRRRRGAGPRRGPPLRRQRGRDEPPGLRAERRRAADPRHARRLRHHVDVLRPRPDRRPLPGDRRARSSRPGTRSATTPTRTSARSTRPTTSSGATSSARSRRSSAAASGPTASAARAGSRPGARRSSSPSTASRTTRACSTTTAVPPRHGQGRARRAAGAVGARRLGAVRLPAAPRRSAARSSRRRRCSTSGAASSTRPRATAASSSSPATRSCRAGRAGSRRCAR